MVGHHVPTWRRKFEACNLFFYFFTSRITNKKREIMNRKAVVTTHDDLVEYRAFFTLTLCDYAKYLSSVSDAMDCYEEDGNVGELSTAITNAQIVFAKKILERLDCIVEKVQ